MIPLRDQLLNVARCYAEVVGTRGRDGRLSLSGISTRIFADGKTFARIAAGGDLTTGSFERAMRWFSDNWPEGAVWPASIERPSQSSTSGKAA